MSHLQPNSIALTSTRPDISIKCTALTNTKPINQPVFVCFTCDQSINPRSYCQECAIRCHIGHDTRATTVKVDRCSCTHQSISRPLIRPSIRPALNESSLNKSPIIDDDEKHIESPHTDAVAQSAVVPYSSQSASQSVKSPSNSSRRSTRTGSSFRDFFESIITPTERPTYRSSSRSSTKRSSNQSVTQPTKQSFICTFKLYGPRFIPQLLFECIDCSFSAGRCICEPCVLRCHAHHRVRISPVQQPAFCDCGESARHSINQSGNRSASRPMHQCKAVKSVSPSLAARLSSLCSLRHTGQNSSSQKLLMCSTCQVMVCANCASICHADHSISQATNDPTNDAYCMCGSSCVTFHLDDVTLDSQLTEPQSRALSMIESDTQRSQQSPRTAQSTTMSSQSHSGSSSGEIGETPTGHEFSSFHDWEEPEKPARGSSADSEPVVIISSMSLSDGEFQNPNAPDWSRWGPEPLKSGSTSDSRVSSSTSQASSGPIIMLSPPAFERAISAPAFDDSSPLDFSPVLPQRIQTEPARASSTMAPPQSLSSLLVRLGLTQYSSVFVQQDLDLHSLAQLDENVWQLLVPVHGHRMRIMNAVKELFTPSLSASLSVYCTVVSDMYGTQHINARDLTLLARLRAQYHISLTQHMQILEDIGISEIEWERVVTLTSIAEAQSAGQSSNQAECCVCYSEAATYIILPCGHLCLCRGCESRIMRGSPCPKCRAVVVATQRIWT